VSTTSPTDIRPTTLQLWQAAFFPLVDGAVDAMDEGEATTLAAIIASRFAHRIQAKSAQ
jgi:hypothetical protein